jgi:uncharacterized cupredoxin-like copper-binding protein
MVRWVIFSIVVVAIAGIATIASTLTFTDDSKPADLIPTAQNVSNGPPGKATVDGTTTYDFGTLAQQTESKHEWVITNKGEGDIILQKGESTCSCTIANLEEGMSATLKPGKSTKVTLTFNTKTNDGKWNQSATVLVNNDPSTQQFKFLITGIVRPPVITLPPGGMIDFGQLENEADHVREMPIFSIDRPDTKFTSAKVANPDILTAEIKSFTPDEMKSLQAQVTTMHGGGEPDHAEHGPGAPAAGAAKDAPLALTKAAKLVVTLKKGATIGAFEDEVIVATDHPKRPGVPIRVAGKVKGPITIVPDQVRALEVVSKEGETINTVIWVRGQKETHFTVDKKPQELDVRITPMAAVPGSNSVRYAMTVKVPPGTQAKSITEDIVLKTDHPLAKELHVRVAILVRAK